jgi:hypothetical protein
MAILRIRQRVLWCVLPVLAAIAFTTTASAQGFLGLPFLGGFSGTQQCGPSGCDPCPTAPHLDFFVGWQGGHKQTLTAHTDQGTSGALFRSIKFDTPNEGIWIGAAATVDLSCKSSLALAGWYLFPKDKSGAYTVDPGLPVALEPLPTDTPGGFAPKVEWWYVDVMGKYRYWDQIGIVFGARFDHHNFSSNDSDFGFAYPTPNRYRLDVNALTTSLFLGLEYASPTGLTLRAIYAPLCWTSGKTRFGQGQLLLPPVGPNEVESSKAVNPRYLAELFLEYSKPVSTSVKLGAFARGTWLHSSGNSSLSETVHAATGSYDFSYDSTSWTVGGKAEFAFNMSGLWN